MWRAVIALAHADGHFAPEERAYIEKILGNMQRLFIVTDEQKAGFADDFAKPKSFGDMLRNINDPAARSELVYFGGILARVDGHLSPDEDAILKQLRISQMSSIDMDSLRLQVKDTLAQESIRRDIERAELGPKKGFSAVLDHFLQRLGIDVLD